jgi:hypothetical protein
MSASGAAFPALIAAAISGWSAYAFLVNVRARREDLRVRALVEGAPRALGDDGPPSQLVTITGVATSAENDFVTTAFSDTPALWSRSTFQNGIGRVSHDWTVFVDTIVVQPKTGAPVTLPVRGATFRMGGNAVESPENRARIEALTPDASTVARTAVFFPYEETLISGQTVSVVGVVTRREGGYRDAPTLAFSPTKTEVIVFDPLVEPRKPEDRRSAIVFAVFGMMVGAAGFAWVMTHY